MPINNKIQHTKKALIEALIKTLGVVTSACEIVNIDRTTFYRYYKEDLEFKNEVDDIQNIALDFAESKLHNLINNENPAAVFFYLKTKGKQRGYIERHEQKIIDTPEINFKNVSKDYELDSDGNSTPIE